MEEALLQGPIGLMEKAGNVVLDIESLTQPPDKCCTGSPKMSRALSRKGSNRMERRSGEEQETDDASKKLVVKVVPSQLDQLKLPLVPNKALVAAQPAAGSPVITDSGEARNKRFHRLTAIHPRKILLLFATVSSMGTMILIYFTLAINRRGGA
ncbi:uncharacterized protein LOC109713009 isoform X1 [Ananas comosus]|uniref:Uncharacterized protein LOC109713009 isoform X1 n=2 Tax=Ananas comosus TaxID=4615 RepID=A0A6P5F976_ANACO|nr:uncharacterized protein LOC109713009 isoform X1 [Ananas comosus]XP_020092504.1 uncharacterized protein LOC109713009 isoform X1 [Ananas comosus]